jgi:transmembrane sensor
MTSQPDNPAFLDASANHAAQDAARWLAALSDERCTDSEREAFLQWLRSSTQHVEEFLRLSTIARRASRRALWPDDSVDALVAAARAASNVAPLESRIEANAAPAPRRPVRWAVAASLVLTLGVGAFVAQPQMDGMLDALRTPTYATAMGEQRSITLEDGSVIQLNSRSQVRARLSHSLRAIELAEGEAIFRVAKDPSRPFRVRVGATDIVAVGTAFNVNASDARTVVTVLEGRVRVERRAASAPRQTVAAAAFELAVGEQLIVSPASPPLKVSLRDTEKVISWTERRLIFEDTPIAAAAAEFARYSPRTIRIEDPRLGERKITAVFDAADPASLVEFLETNDAIEVRVVDDGWVVSNKK